MTKAKKVDRSPLESGKKRVGATYRVDPDVKKHASKECKRIYKMGLSSKIENFLIKEFPRK